MDIDHKDNGRLWQLLARKTANEITGEESIELSKLLQQHPDALYAQEIMLQEWHDSYKRFSETDTDAAFEKHKSRLQHAFQESKTADIEEDILPNKPVIYRKMILRRASVAVACMIVAFFVFKKNELKQPGLQPEVLQQLATQYGSKSQLVLPDGTKVWLNAGSRLDYPKQFTGAIREVTLEGEAYFDVTANKQQPFWVHTRAFTVKVIGTAFNIRAYADEDSAATSLIRGAVEVELTANKKNTVRLHANEKLTVPVAQTGNQEELKGNSNVDIEKKTVPEIKKTVVTTDKKNTVVETAWMENKLAFKNMSFVQIAQSLEKWFAVEIQFRNEAKKKLRLSGTFEGESLEEILNAFRATGSESFSFKKDSSGKLLIY
ncbi:MAG: FecR family protein [Chitinophagaceae bacterium]|nr:FecR family protein [Chitinophagaceae bacterium]